MNASNTIELRDRLARAIAVVGANDIGNQQFVFRAHGGAYIKASGDALVQAFEEGHWRIDERIASGDHRWTVLPSWWSLQKQFACITDDVMITTTDAALARQLAKEFAVENGRAVTVNMQTGDEVSL